MCVSASEGGSCHPEPCIDVLSSLLQIEADGTVDFAKNLDHYEVAVNPRYGKWQDAIMKRLHDQLLEVLIRHLPPHTPWAPVTSAPFVG